MPRTAQADAAKYGHEMTADEKGMAAEEAAMTELMIYGKEDGGRR